MAEARVPLTVVVLTHDEERNLPACLESVAGWADEIVVVDSGSTDGTLEIAAQHGARVVSHPFETHARQWSWALSHAPISGEWILALDADQRLTPELAREIREVVRGGGDAADGYYINRRQVFRGRWIKHGGYYPKYLLKLFRRGAAVADEGDLVDHHFRVRGAVAKLHHDMVEDNRNEADISVWVAKHNRYAVLQAEQDLRDGLPGAGVAPRLRGSPDERVAWMKSLWARLPPYLRPCLYFCYRYVFRLGFLDGKEGFVFHFLQAWWYRLLVDIKTDELRPRKR